MTTKKDKPNLNEVEDINDLSLEDLEALDKEIEASNLDEEDFDFEEVSFDQDFEDDNANKLELDEISDLDFEKDLEDITNSKNKDNSLVADKEVVSNDLDEELILEDFDFDSTEEKINEIDDINIEDINDFIANESENNKEQELDLEIDFEEPSSVSNEKEDDSFDLEPDFEANDLNAVSKDEKEDDSFDLDIDFDEKETISKKDSDEDLDLEIDFDLDNEELSDLSEESKEVSIEQDLKNDFEKEELVEPVVDFDELDVSDIEDVEVNEEDFDIDFEEELEEENKKDSNLNSTNIEKDIDLESEIENLNLEEIEENLIVDNLSSDKNENNVNFDENDFEVDNKEQDSLLSDTDDFDLDSFKDIDIEKELEDLSLDDEDLNLAEENKNQEDLEFFENHKNINNEDLDLNDIDLLDNNQGREEMRNNFTEDELEDLDLEELEKIDKELSEEDDDIKKDFDDNLSNLSQNTEENKKGRNRNKIKSSDTKEPSLFKKALIPLAVVAALGLGGLYYYSTMGSSNEDYDVNEPTHTPKKVQATKKQVVATPEDVSKDELLSFDSEVNPSANNKATKTPKVAPTPEPVVQAPVVVPSANYVDKSYFDNQMKSMGSTVNSLVLEVNKANAKNNNSENAIKAIEKLNNDFNNLNSQFVAFQEKVNKDTEDLNNKMLVTMKASKRMIEKSEENEVKYNQRISELESKYKEQSKAPMPTSKVEQKELSDAVQGLQKTVSDRKANSNPIAKQINKKKTVEELLKEQSREPESKALSLTVDRSSNNGSINEADDYAPVERNVEKKYYKPKYKMSGVIDQLAYIQDASGIVTTYSKDDILVGWGKILKIYIDGRVQTESGFVTFEDN